MADILLILDLDETLIHATEEPRARPPDFRVAQYSCYRRPHLDEFLGTIADWFELAVWSSSSPGYARQVVDQIFGPRASALDFVWASDRCTYRYDPDQHVHYPVKNFKKVRRRGRDLDRVLVVDDTPQKHERNYGNLIRVREYLGEEDDDELPDLLLFLDWLRRRDDPRAVEKRGWRERRPWEPRE